MAGEFAVSNEAVRVKKFYKTATIKPVDDGFGVLLDGKQAKTQRRMTLAAPTEALAKAIAIEWNEQEGFVEQSAMPLTGMLSAAIDGGEKEAETWREDILKYLGTDLVCYRADGPEKLIARQAKLWDPYLDWMHDAFAVSLKSTSGIVAVAQPSAATETVRENLTDQSPATLFALQLATAISGSAVLALALWKKAFDAEEIFEASRLDERFQEELWGVDAEAKEREDRLRRDFMVVSRFLSLLV